MPLDFSAFDEKEPQGLDFSAIDKEEPNKGLDFSAIDADKPGLNPAREAPEQPGMFSNIARGIGERAGELAGNLASIGSRVADVGEEALPLGGITWGKDGLDFASGEEWEQHRQDKQFKEVRPLESAGQAMKDLDLGYKPRNTWEEVKESYNKGDVLGTIGDAVAFGFEVGAVSLPDMAAAITTLPAYVTSRTEELATERANNQGREEANAEDYAIGAPTAITVSILERFGAQQLLKMSKGGSIVGGLVKGAAYEGLTETQQEMVEYLGANAGTKEGATFNGAIERGLQGLIGGGTFGGVAGGVSAAAGKMAGTDESADPSTPETTPQDPLPDEHELEVEAAEQGPKPYEVGGILGNINPNAGLADPAPTMDGPPTPTQKQVAQRPESIEYDYAGAPAAQDPMAVLGASAGQPQYEGGIDFEPEGPAPLQADIESPHQAERRVDQDERIGALQDELRDVKLPDNFTDSRMKRAGHRASLGAMANDLTKGGGLGVLYDERGKVTERLPSVNPAWFKEWSENKPSVEKIQKTVDKALAGKKLGVGEQRIITTMLDDVTGERTSPDSMDFARDRLESHRKMREMGFGTPVENVTGESFMEDSYDETWSIQGRQLREIIEEAEQKLGYNEVERVIIQTEGADPFTVMQELDRRMYGDINAEETATAAFGDQVGSGPVEKGQEGRPETGEAPAAAGIGLPSPDAGLSDPGTKSPEGKLPITQTPPSNKASSPQDLLGDDTRTEQAAADLSREKDEKRSPGGAQPAEAQSGDDLFAGGGQLEADLFSSSPGAEIESKADNVQGSPEKAAAKKVAPKATPKTTGQNVKRGTFELIPANNGGIIVKGDKAAIRAQLKEAGIDAKGLPMRDGLRFGKSQAEGVRGILEGKPPTKPAESVKTPSESTILATPKKQYINRMIKQAGIKKASPGYKAVVERTEAEYEAELDKAYAEMSFDEYQERNADVPESVNRQAHKQLQDEYGVKADLPSVETVTKPGAASGKNQKTSHPKQGYYDAVSKGIFRDRVPAAIQTDGQKLLDAIDSTDISVLDKLINKYSKDAGLDQGGVGAGPGKTKQARPGAAQLWGLAVKAKDEFQPKQKKADVTDQLKQEKPVEAKEQAEKKAESQAAGEKAGRVDVSDNKIFTEDAAEKARALLKSKLSQLSSGVDPEIMQAGITMAGYHIEKGARTFAAYSKAMVGDLGEAVRPYLRSWYEGVRHYPGMEGHAKGMTPINQIGNDGSTAIDDGWKKKGDEGAKAGDVVQMSNIHAIRIERLEYNQPDGSHHVVYKSAYKGTGDGGWVELDGRRADNRVTFAKFVRLTGVYPAADRQNSPEFTPTHELSNGDLVVATDEDGVWLDAEGMEIEDDSATPLEAKQAKLKERDKTEETHEPKQLDQSGQGSLEGISTDHVPRATESRDSGSSLEGSGRTDAQGNEPTGEPGLSESRSLGDDEGALPVSTAGTESRRNRSQSRSQSVPRSGSGTESVAAGQPRAVTPAKDRATNFTISPDIQIGAGGAKTKFKGNIAAIELLKRLQAENRQATRDEQAVLAKYVGWGGIPQAFYKDGDVTTNGWDKEAAGLKALLTDEEYNAARRSTQDAHYTSTEIVSSIWNAVQQFGFQGGKVLEPSVGVGNFFGLMPGELRSKSGLTGVELDHVTGGIAKQLYPGAHILDATGFQDLTAPDGTYDLAIGNPPFGSQKLYDGKRKHLSKFSIHNYFFGKSVDLLKPNGVLGMVVSNSMMDAYGDRARQYISDRTEFLGAIRLPNNAFLKNAGTEVTTDIIFLRKLAEGEQPSGESWMDVQEINDPDGKDNIPLNEYFVRHPENMLGRMERSGSMYRADAPALIAEEGQDTGKLLSEAVSRMKAGFMEEPGRAPVTERVEVARDVEDVRVGSMFAKEGEIYIRTEDVENVPKADKMEFTRKYKGELIPDKKAAERVRGMIFVRDALARLRKAQLGSDVTTGKLKLGRAALNRAYDNFVKKQGPINQDANKRVFRDDPTWPQIAALEEGFDKGVSAAVARRTGEKPRKPSAKKAAIFTKRTQSPYKPVESVNSAKDALVATLSEKGRVDIDYMAGIYDRSSGQIISELQGLILKSPVGGWETREEYLSGNVKAKLAIAEGAAKSDPDYQENVDALNAVQPTDIEAVDIDVKIGAHWLPPQVMADFVDHITGGEGNGAVYSPFNAKWSFDAKQSAADKSAQWGTDRRRPVDLLTDIANQKTTVVRDTTIDKKTVVNEAATNAAQEKAGLIKEEWRRWVWQDDVRRAELGQIYNESFNTDVIREFDGSHLVFPGQVSDDIIKLRPHQANAVWRTIQSGATLLDHVVGAGKTFTVIASVMEMRRLGLSKKPVIVVPNHLVGQWAEDFIQLYPGANILAATKKDFEKNNRKKLFARISTGDWDAVIVAHSSFGKVEVDPEYQERFIKEQIKDLDTALAALKEADSGKSRSVKDAEKQKERLEEKLKKLFDAENKDNSMYFGELGIDALFLDEAHEFKNLAFATSMTRVAGLGNPQGSQKASDMFMKIQYTLDKTGGRNVVFATGTPISNTMAEMYTMQRYLSYGTLKAKGLAHFDAWARQYGEVVSDWELSPSGTYKLNSRFAKFVNMPELMQDYLSAADVINRDDINEMLAKQGKKLPVPKIKGGKPQNVVVERSDSQAVYIGEPLQDEHGNDTDKYPEGTLVWRAENLPKGPPKKGDDNMLKIMSDARKAALDMRMISPGYSDNEQSKINYAAGEILRMYKAWDKHKGAQLVFIDLSTPKGNRAKEAAAIRALIDRAEAGDQAAEAQLDKLSPDQLSALDGGDFSVYDDLRQKLINLGIPDNEIAYIHQANTELQKEEMFGKVRSGRIRVLLGSTAKMGAGMNVQERLVALHHMDAPWRPSDLEQREGRIVRQGNALYDLDPEGFEIEILRYATKQTLDSRMWQTIEGKARFIEQVRKGNMLSREVEDVAGEAANAAEMKAASSGNPLILEEMELRTAIRKLEGLQYAHDKQQFRIQDSIKHNQNVIALQEKTQSDLEKDIQTRGQKGSEKFSIKIEGKTYNKRKDAGARLLLSAAALAKSGKPFKKVGEYAGFTITLDNLEKRGFVVSLVGAGEYQIDLKDISQADPTGLSTRIANITKGFESQLERSKGWQEEAVSVIPGLKEQIGVWGKAGELDATKKRHADVIKELKPKRQEQPEADVNDTKTKETDSMRESAMTGQPMFAKNKGAQGNAEKGTGTKQDQEDVAILNKELDKYYPGEGFKDAYIPDREGADGLRTLEEGVKVAFQKRLVPIRGTAPDFDINGVNIPANNSALYISTTSDVSWINVVGHELYHSLKRSRPDLHEFLLEHLRENSNHEKYQKYAERLENRGEDTTLDIMEEELLADIAGDALADPVFLQQMADDNPTKFKKLLNAVHMWLSKIKNKLKGFESGQYLDDVEAMRQHLRTALNAYASGKSIVETMDGGPKFAAAIKGKLTPEFRKWFGDSKVVDDNGEPMVVYHGTNAQSIDQFKNREIGFHFAEEEVLAVNAAVKGGKFDAVAQKFFLSLKNPVVLNKAPGNGWPVHRTLDALQEEGVITQGEYNAAMDQYDIAEEIFDWGLGTDQEFADQAAPIVTDLLAGKGHDGIKYWNEFDSGHTDFEAIMRGDESDIKPGWSYIAFSPNQIKSIHNKKPAPDSRIMFSRKDKGEGESIDDLHKRSVSTVGETTNGDVQRGGVPGVPGKPKFSRKDKGEGDALSRARGKIGKKSTWKDTWKEVKESPKAIAKDWWKGVEQGMFDRFSGIKNALKEAGQDLPMDQNGYIAARLSTSVADRLAVLLKHAQMKWQDGVLAPIEGTKGFLEVLEPVSDKLDEFGMFLIGNRSADLESQGKTTGFSSEEIKAMQDLGSQHPDFARVAKEYAAINKSVLDVAEEAGIIDPGTRPMWEKENYVPFYRIMEEGSTKPKGPMGKRGIAGQNSGIKQFKGSERSIGDPIENIMMNWAHLLDASVKNHAARMTVDNLHGSGLLEKAPHQFKKRLISAEDARQNTEKLLEDAGMDAETAELLSMAPTLQGMTKLWSIEPPGGPDVIQIMRDGKPEYYHVYDPLLLRSMTAINQQQWSKMMEIFRKPKRLLTAMVTADPSFMARNYLRDVLSAWVLGRDNFVPGIDSIKGAAKAFREDADMVKYMAAGGTFSSGGYINAHDPGEMKRFINAEMDHKAFNKSLLNTPKKLWDFWQHLGASIENANRVAVATAAEKAGKGMTGAAYEMKDVMDFAMRGDYAAIQFLAETVPFFSARLQGLHRLGRGAAENPKAFAAKGSMIMLASIALLMANRDDERFKELEEWDRDTYFHFFIGDEHYRLPKPFEVGVLFGTMPERLVESMIDEDRNAKDFFDRLKWNFMETLAMEPIPQTVKPMMEQWANKSFFTDRPIIGMRLERLAAEAQYEPWTSETMRVLGKAWGMSPKRAESMVRGYFGTLGSYALAASDAVVRSLGDYPEGVTKKPEDYPILKSFYRGDGVAKNTRFITKFYEMTREVNELQYAIYEYRRQGEASAANGLMAEHADKLRNRKGINNYRKKMSSINKEVRKIHYNRNMKPEVKRAKLDRLTERRNNIAKKAVDRYGD